MTAAVPHISNKYQGVASPSLQRAVQTAAARTGVDFSFLMEKAAAESGFDVKAQARTSSARGLYQFIESTWLSMVQKHGEAFGLGDLADQIETKNGKPCVGDCAVKDKILALRDNPEISALMAGAFTAENRTYLESHTKGPVGKTELYLAHFMGARGAADFLNARAENGGAKAAEMFPAAARANKNVFFDKATGAARTLDAVYARFAHKFTGGELPSSPSTTAASPLSIAARPAGAPATATLCTLSEWAGQAHPFSSGRISPFSFLSLIEMTQGMPSSGFGTYRI